jgi:hypothetical protein
VAERIWTRVELACFIASSALNVAALWFCISRPGFLAGDGVWFELVFVTPAASLVAALVVRRRWGAEVSLAVVSGALVSVGLLVILWLLLAATMSS